MSTTTLIGQNTRVNGRVSGDSPIELYGAIYGTVELSDTITIHKDALVDGNIIADNVVVFGVVRGHIVAKNQLVIGSTGLAQATVQTHLLTMEDGARISGEIETHVGNPENAKPLSYNQDNSKRNNRQNSNSRQHSRSFIRPNENRSKEDKNQSKRFNQRPNDPETVSAKSNQIHHEEHSAGKHNASGALLMVSSSARRSLNDLDAEELTQAVDSSSLSSNSKPAPEELHSATPATSTLSNQTLTTTSSHRPSEETHKLEISSTHSLSHDVHRVDEEQISPSTHSTEASEQPVEPSKSSESGETMDHREGASNHEVRTHTDDSNAHTSSKNVHNESEDDQTLADPKDNLANFIEESTSEE